jgi:hypothetical protein
MDPKELPLDPRHVGVSSGVSTMISEPMIPSAKILHQSCIEINIITKLTETSIHLTEVN